MLGYLENITLSPQKNNGVYPSFPRNDSESFFVENKVQLKKLFERFVSSVQPRRLSVGDLLLGKKERVDWGYIPHPSLVYFRTKKPFAGHQAFAGVNTLYTLSYADGIHNNEFFRWDHYWREPYMETISDGWPCKKNRPRGIAGLNKGNRLIRYVYYIGCVKDSSGNARLTTGIFGREIACFFGAAPRTDKIGWRSGWCPASVEVRPVENIELEVRKLTLEEVYSTLMELHQVAKERRLTVSCDAKP